METSSRGQEVWNQVLEDMSQVFWRSLTGGFDGSLSSIWCQT